MLVVGPPRRLVVGVSLGLSLAVPSFGRWLRPKMCVASLLGRSSALRSVRRLLQPLVGLLTSLSVGRLLVGRLVFPYLLFRNSAAAFDLLLATPRIAVGFPLFQTTDPSSLHCNSSFSLGLYLCRCDTNVGASQPYFRAARVVRVL